MIAKKIHYCWLSGEPYPIEIDNYILSWKEKLPDYEFILWDIKRFDINSVRWVKEAYDAKKYAFASDYIRFYALYHYGGIYLDSDVEVLKPFDDLLYCQSFIGFEYSGVLEPAIIGAVKNCSWIKSCMDWYNDRSFYDEKGKTKEMVLPMIIGTIYENIFNFKLIDENKICNFNENYLYPYKYFSPKNCYNNQVVKSNDSYTIHHFKSAWLKKSFSIRLRKYIHILLLKILGKRINDLLIYKNRSMKIYLKNRLYKIYF